jgi:hypothetical protein
MCLAAEATSLLKRMLHLQLYSPILQTILANLLSHSKTKSDFALLSFSIGGSGVLSFVRPGGTLYGYNKTAIDYSPQYVGVRVKETLHKETSYSSQLLWTYTQNPIYPLNDSELECTKKTKLKSAPSTQRLNLRYNYPDTPCGLLDLAEAIHFLESSFTSTNKNEGFNLISIHSIFSFITLFYYFHYHYHYLFLIFD